MKNTNEYKVTCEVCGSTNTIKSQKERYFPIPYGQPALIHQSVVTCQDCGLEIDSTNEEDNKSAIEMARQESIRSMLDFLVHRGYSLAQIERSLDLPQRTISRWKGSGELSSIGIALLRILRTYPWIIEVAENKYDEFISKTTLISEAAKSFLQLKQCIDPSVVGFGYVQVTVTDSNQNFFAMISQDFDKNFYNNPGIQQIEATIS
jgi:hypothetical protein